MTLLLTQPTAGQLLLIVFIVGALVFVSKVGNLKPLKMTAILLLIGLNCQAQLMPSQLKMRAEIERTCKELGLDSVKTKIVKSIAFRESSFRLIVYNHIDGSAGLYGETRRFVDDVNRISGKNYQYSYRYNLRWSTEMLVIYLNHYSDWSLKNVCYMWHRSMYVKRNYKYYTMIVKENLIVNN